MVNIYANFDILYLLHQITVKYNELSRSEIHSLLYFAQLLSICDGSPAGEWGYVFSTTKLGAPISLEIIQELESLEHQGHIMQKKDDYYKLINNSDVLSIVDTLSKQNVLSQRTKYIRCVINSLLTKSLPLIVNAMQNEPGIATNTSLARSEILYDKENVKADRLYKDFKVIRNFISDQPTSLIIPASIWIDYLTNQ